MASDAMLWRALEEIGDNRRARIATAWARTHVWTLIEARHGRIPVLRVADNDLGKTGVIQIALLDKEGAAGTVKGTSAR